MPGVGPRSAERIALWMVQSRHEQPEQIAAAITEGIFRYRDLVKQRPATIAVTPGITE